MEFPNDPVILLSFVNMHLRDNCPTLTDFCARNETDQKLLEAKLAQIGYQYDAARNQFV